MYIIFIYLDYLYHRLIPFFPRMHVVGAEYSHVHQMLPRVLIIIFIKFTDVYLSSMLYVVVFMFVARRYS
jgi:hypothetical protein